MAENLHRVAKKCGDRLQQFVDARVPAYSAEQDEAAEPKGKGKRKAPSAAEDATLSLEFKGERPEALSQEFLGCVGVKPEEKDKLKEDEKTLLEYLEIYLELKEKVDGIKETIAGAVAKEAKDEEKATTTIGFGQTDSSAAAAPAVNMIPVVKKRKTEAKAEIPADKTEEKNETSAPADSK
ncbi:hypothetical protein ON010_g17944 [Phytophthora cinnamomi]|nr:hypothetical protein ON010_g17944 [Phytophthora cinnamomi]